MKKELIIFVLILPSMVVSSQEVENIIYSYDNNSRLSFVIYQSSIAIEYCYDELGNRTCEIITSDSISQPDIFIADLDVSADDLCQSATFEISVSQDNLGNLATGSFTFEVRLSTDTVYDNTDVLLLSQYLQSIDPAGSIEINETLELPDDLPGGEYYIIVKADPENTVNELSEENNIDFIAITISENNGYTLVNSTLPDTCYQGIGSASIVVLGGLPPYTYQWNTTPVQVESTATNLTEGIYSVTVTDYMGCQTVEDVTISNLGSPPSPSFAHTVNGLEVSFENTTPTADSYIWDFGDGANAIIESPTHEYIAQGIYVVCLSIMNTCGSNQHCLEVGVGSGCETPENLVITSATGNSINMTWDHNPMALSYSLVYRLKDSITWSTEIVLETNQASLSGLLPETTYEIKIKSNCGFGSSDYSIPLTGRTGLIYLQNYSEFMMQFEEICGYCGPYTKASDIAIINNKIILSSTCGYGNNTRYIIVAFDLNGNILWSQGQDFTENVNLIDIDFMSDGNLIICLKAGNYVYISRLTQTGNWVWTKKVNQSVSHAGINIGFEVSYDNYIYLSYYQRFEGEAYYYLSKYSDQGDLIFSKRIQESGETHPYRIRNILIDSTGNIFVMGSIGRSSGYEWLFNKHDSLGALLWTKVIRPGGNNDFDKIEKAIFSQDGGFYIISDDYEAGNQDIKIAKLDSSGAPLWVRNFNNVLPTSLALYSDGIAVSGISDGAGAMFWIDSLGELIEYPSKLSVPSQINDIFVLNNQLLLTGSIHNGTNQRITLFSLDMAANEYDFLCNDSYIGDDGNITSSTIIDENFSFQNTSGISDLVDEQIESDSICLVNTLICGIEENYLVVNFNSSDSIVCVNQKVEFYFTGTGALEYLYFILNSTDTLSTNSYGEVIFSEAGEHIICLVASNEELADTAYMTIIVHDIPIYDVQSNESYCFMSSGTAEIINCLCTDPVTYQWESGSTLSIDTALAPGFYSVAVIDSNGCEMITSFEVFAIPLLEFIDTSICPGNEITLRMVGGEFLDSVDIVWSNGQNGSDINVNLLNTTTYSVSIENNIFFCTESVEVNIDYNQCPCNIVWSPIDSGIGTLRNAIECALPGDTIQFARVLEGDTIIVTSDALSLIHDVVIKVDEDLIIIVMDSTSGFTFIINPTAQVLIQNITILKNTESSTIYNEGILTLKDVILKNFSELNENEALIHNLGSVFITGNVEISKAQY